MTAFAGDKLEVMRHTETSRTPGVLTLTRVYTQSKLSVHTFKTSGAKAGKP